MEKIYDVMIIGGGPAGYTAALYGARAGLSVLVLEKMYAGGQMTQTSQIDNYPGFPEGIDGVTLGMQMQSGAQKFGAETINTEVLSVHLEGAVKSVETGRGTYFAKTVILATGAGHKHLEVAGEEDLIGRGVAYCAACDGMFYRGKTVAVVGGGNTAAADALTLSRIAEKVYLIHRRDQLRAEGIYREQLHNAGNVDFLWNSNVTELISGEKLIGIKVQNLYSGEESELRVDGLFVSVGMSPATRLFQGQLELDESGYIVAGESTQTGIPGVYAAGDVRTKESRQIITAAADGAVAAYQAQLYLAQ